MKHLYSQPRDKYVSSLDTPHEGILARWLWERSSANPANYPETAESYQADQIAEHASMQIKENRR